MSAAAGCQLIGKWRIVKADIWDRDYLDLVEPAHITFSKNGRGEFAFGALNATMELEYAHRTVFFKWSGFDEGDEINVTPHIAQNNSRRRSAIDGRTTRHPGYAVSLRIRKRIEEGFGWMKTIAGLRKTKYRGLEKVGWAFTLAAAAYNLVRLPKLLAETP